MAGLRGSVLGAALVGLSVAASALPSWPDVAAGSYLAGIVARDANDFDRSTEYFARALQADPDNPVLLENALRGYTSLGRLDMALPLAEQLDHAGAKSEIGAIVRISATAKAGDWAGLIDLVRTPGLPVAPAIADLVRGWAEIGTGRLSEGLKVFDQLAKDRRTAGLGLYHKALALALAGDYEAADGILSGRDAQQPSLTRRGLTARAEIKGMLEHGPEGAALLRRTFGDDLEPGLARLADRLAAGEPVPFDVITDPLAGVAEVFFTAGASLAAEAPSDLALAFARMAEALDPHHYDAILLSAALFERLGRYELAVAAYDRIPRQSDHAYLAELGRASALRRGGKVDAAIDALQRMASEYDRNPAVLVTLGDTLRRADRFGEATAAYDRAIALYDRPEDVSWVIYFSRGIALERDGNWARAEADLRMALKLQPDQPQVLNYLGYSLIDQNRDLDEALDMIQRAVKGQPDDGYITDSLGWAFYRLGRYDDAVVQMERAVELTPVDPIITDHLGDVLWAVGRTREAEFQWKRALSFSPTEKEAARIRRKLAVGLDQVLKEEGAAPLAVSKR